MEENLIYSADVSLKEIIKIMKTNIYGNFFKKNYFFISSDYLISRSSLFSLIRKISNNLGFKSQTYFLSIYYLDILFSKNKKIECNFKILGLACLLLSAKFIENYPSVPNLSDFIKAYNDIVGNKNIISVAELFYAEVLACKMLGYKLNYYTIYDFDSFFVSHGIIKFEQLRELNNGIYSFNNNDFEINSSNSLYIRHILEKIYRKSRYYLELIVNNSFLCLKYNSLLISVFIMKKSVEDILVDELRINKHDIITKEKFLSKTSKCFKEIMNELYQIDYESLESYIELIVDKDLMKILQEEKKSNLSPVLVNLENNNVKLAYGKIKNSKDKKEFNYLDRLKTISAYSHINRINKNNNNSISNNSISNTSLKKTKILSNNNLTRNINDYNSHKNKYPHNSFKISPKSKKINSSNKKNNLNSFDLDLSNLNSSKEVNKIEPKINKYRYEIINQGLSKPSDRSGMRYLQRLTTYNIFNKKKSNDSISINKNNNNSISLNEDEDIINIINSMEKLDNNKTIQVESPLRKEKNNFFEKYKKINGLKKKPFKHIKSYIKSNEYSTSLFKNNTINAINSIKPIENENNSKNFTNIENNGIKPYFKKVIKNIANNSSINNLKNLLSEKKNTESYFSSINIKQKRKELNSLINNKFIFKENKKGKEKGKENKLFIYLNASQNDNNNATNEFKAYDKNNKSKYKNNRNININAEKTENIENIDQNEKKINLLGEKFNKIHNKKRRIFLNNIIDCKEEKEYIINGKEDKNQNKDNIIKLKKVTNEEASHEIINKKDDKEKKYITNERNRDIYSLSSSSSYISKRKEKKILFNKINYSNNKKDYYYSNNNSTSNDNNKIEYKKIDINNSKKDEYKTRDNFNSNKINKYYKRIKRQDSKSEIKENKTNISYFQSKEKPFSKRKFFLMNKSNKDFNIQKSEEEEINNDKNGKKYEGQNDLNKKETNKQEDNIKYNDNKAKSIRYKYINKINKRKSEINNKNNDSNNNDNKEENKLLLNIIDNQNNNKKEDIKEFKNNKEKGFIKNEKVYKWRKNQNEEKGEEKISVNKKNRNKRDLKLIQNERDQKSTIAKNQNNSLSILSLDYKTKNINNKTNLDSEKKELNLDFPNNYIINYNKRNKIIRNMRTKDDSREKEKERNTKNILTKEILIPKEIPCRIINTDIDNTNINNNRIIHSYHYRKLLKNKLKDNLDSNNNSNKDINLTTNKTASTIVINNNININFNNKIEPIQGRYIQNILKRSTTENNNTYLNKIILNKTDNNNLHKSIFEKYDGKNKDNDNNIEKIRRKKYYNGRIVESTNINKNNNNQKVNIFSLLNRMPLYKRSFGNNRKNLNAGLSEEIKYH